MELSLNPVLLYLGLVLGAVGVAVALPRPRVNPQVIGGVIVAAAFAGLLVLLGRAAVQAGQLPNPFFYVFAVIAILSSLRVVTHQRPVYAALFFIMTILSSSAMYLLLEAEFLAFALIIIYAGAILITYLFVIMLATQAPTEGEVGALSPYDAYSREPVIATGLGFLLLAVLTSMLATGVNELRVYDAAGPPSLSIAELPGKVVRSLEERGLLGGAFEPIEAGDVVERLSPDQEAITVVVRDPARLASRAADARVWPLLAETESAALDIAAAAAPGSELDILIPEDASTTNLDAVGWALIAGHPMALEVAGVILLMALLGAVVLARKQIEIGERAKEVAAGVASGAPESGGVA